MLLELVDWWTLGHVAGGILLAPLFRRVYWPLVIALTWEVLEAWMHPLGIGDPNMFNAFVDVIAVVGAWAIFDHMPWIERVRWQLHE